MTETFIMTDGTDSIDCTDPDSGYTIVANGFRPTVAQRQENHPEIFGHVDEEVRLTVSGATPAQANQRLRLLAEMVDRSERAWRGEVTTAVTLQYEIDGSGLAAPLTVMVTGAPESGDVLQLPADYDSATATTKIGSVSDPVIWRWRRRGALLAGEVATQSNGLANPSVMQCLFSGTQPSLPSPVKVKVDDFSAAIPSTNYLLVAKSTADLKVMEVEAATDATTAGTWSTPTDAGKNPRGSNIGRWAAGNTNWQFVALTSAMSGRAMDVYVAARQNDSARTWQLKAGTRTSAPRVANSETRPVTLAYNGGLPQIVPLGRVFAATNSHDELRLYFRVDSISGTPTIDFDYILLHIVDGDTNHAVRVLMDTTFTSASFDITYDHRLLTRPEPIVLYDNGAGATAPLGYDSPPTIYSTGQIMAGIWAATYDDQWRHTNAAKSAVSVVTMTGTRRIAYLLPE